jgi:hypothetical protein
VVRVGEKISVFRVVVGKHEGKRPPVKPISKYEDNIKINFKEVELEDVDCIDLFRVRTNNGQFLTREGSAGFVSARKYLKILGAVSFSRISLLLAVISTVSHFALLSILNFIL